MIKDTSFKGFVIKVSLVTKMSARSFSLADGLYLLGDKKCKKGSNIQDEKGHHIERSLRKILRAI